MSDHAEIQPALTDEEWATMADRRWMRLPEHGGDVQRQPDGGLAVFPNGEGAWLHGRDRYIVAALCLDGQPYGFTHEDVAELRDMAESWEQEAAISEEHGLWVRADSRGVWGKNAESCRRRAAATRSLADRIAALLPRDP